MESCFDGLEGNFDESSHKFSRLCDSVPADERELVRGERFPKHYKQINVDKQVSFPMRAARQKHEYCYGKQNWASFAEEARRMLNNQPKKKATWEVLWAGEQLSEPEDPSGPAKPTVVSHSMSGNQEVVVNFGPKRQFVEPSFNVPQSTPVRPREEPTPMSTFLGSCLYDNTESKYDTATVNTLYATAMESVESSQKCPQDSIIRRGKARVDKGPIERREYPMPENFGDTYAQPRQNLNTTYAQPRQDLNTTYAQPRKNLNTTYAQPRQNLNTTYAQPRQNLNTTYAKPRECLGNTYIKPRQNLGNTFVKPRQNLGDTYTKPRQNLGNTFTKTSKPCQSFGNTYTEPRPSLGNTYIQHSKGCKC